MTKKAKEHHFARFEQDRVVCGCGHVEVAEVSLDDDPRVLLDQMNAHIKNQYTEAEWEEWLTEARVALLDGKTGVLTLPAEGKKS